MHKMIGWLTVVIVECFWTQLFLGLLLLEQPPQPEWPERGEEPLLDGEAD